MVISDGRVVSFVSERIKTKIFPPYSALGIERDGRVVAGIVFNGYNHNAIEITVAAERGALTRAFIRGCARYVFEGLGCLRVSVTTEQKSIIDLVQRLGGEIEGCKRNHFGRGRDGIILGILREDWKI